jgi:hypothetical protein
VWVLVTNLPAREARSPATPFRTSARTLHVTLWAWLSEIAWVRIVIGCARRASALFRCGYLTCVRNNSPRRPIGSLLRSAPPIGSPTTKLSSKPYRSIGTSEPRRDLVPGRWCLRVETASCRDSSGRPVRWHRFGDSVPVDVNGGVSSPAAGARPRGWSERARLAQLGHDRQGHNRAPIQRGEAHGATHIIPTRRR